MSRPKTARALAALLLCAALAASVLPAPVSAAVSGVSVYHDTINGKTANLVSISMTATRTGKLVLAGDSVVQDAPAADLVAKGAANGTVVAAINGGFFASYYKTNQPITFPANCPQILNTVIVDGRLVNAGGLWTVLGFTKDGKAMIDKATFNPAFKLESGFTPMAWATNCLLTDPSAIMHFTDEMTLPVQIPADSTMYFIRDGKVVDITAGGPLTVPKNTDVLVYNKAIHDYESTIGTNHGYGRTPKLGEAVEVTYSSSPRTAANKALWDDMDTVVGGGPLLLLNGQIATDQNAEVTDPKQQPDVVLQRSFVAITWGGDLIFGTVTASFNQIAAYLKQAGIKDAMAMDGGASSMLYAAGSGYQTSAGRKLTSVLTIVDTAAPAPAPAPTPTPAPAPAAGGTAYQNSVNVVVDGKTVSFPMYSSTADKSSNFIRIRDLAYILKGTNAEFNITWTQETGTALQSHTSYVVPPTYDTSMAVPFSGDQPYVDPGKPIPVDGVDTALECLALQNGAYTYYKLRDLGIALNFNVGWTRERGLFVETDKPYDPSN